ncbi:MAG: hypothetical protein ABGW84_06480 [Sphingomonadaceae bacterium]
MIAFKPAACAALAALLLAGCSEASDTSEDETPIPVEPDGGIGDGAPPLDEVQAQGRSGMPPALRGEWREDDLGRAPTIEDCDQTSDTNRNFGKVMTVSANGFSLFEQGGTIVELHDRSESKIVATFDTSYADEIASERMEFALQPDGSLTVDRGDDAGVPSMKRFRPCPEMP